MKAEIWHHGVFVKHNKFATKGDLVCKYEQMLREAGFTTMGFLEHEFEPQGYSRVWLLAESHFAIHTFPEAGQDYIEISSCNLKMYTKFLQLFGVFGV